MSICLGRTLPRCKLVELNSHALFSKFFGESGKAVSKLFSAIESILQSDKNAFMVIFIDEVESLATTRQYSVDSIEPRDTLRIRRRFFLIARVGY